VGNFSLHKNHHLFDHNIFATLQFEHICWDTGCYRKSTTMEHHITACQLYYIFNQIKQSIGTITVCTPSHARLDNTASQLIYVSCYISTDYSISLKHPGR